MPGTALGIAALLLVAGTFGLWGQRIKHVQIPQPTAAASWPAGRAGRCSESSP